MSQHHATIEWNRNGSPFKYGRYSRADELRFHGIAVFLHLAMHQKAHEKCFSANSVKTQAALEPC